jgi:hypothetical protein
MRLLLILQEGDQLIAIEQFNVTTAPAKMTLRLLNSLPWPRTLVFETRFTTKTLSVLLFQLICVLLPNS